MMKGTTDTPVASAALGAELGRQPTLPGPRRSPFGSAPGRDGDVVPYASLIEAMTKRPSQPAGSPMELPVELCWSVLEDSPNSIWLVDGSGRILWSNRASETYLEAAPGRNLFEILPPEKAQHRRLMLNALRRTGEPIEFVDHHGSWWEVNIRATSVPDVFVFWQRNVDRRVGAEEDLRRSLSRAVTIQEDERRRISRDLHDETGQALTGLILELRDLSRRLEVPELRERSERAAAMATALMKEMRSVLHQLNPPSLKTKPLKTAMAEYCALFSDRTGIRVIFEAAAPPKRLTGDQSTTLYRLLQEGLTNVARHSKASKVWVSLAVDAEHHEVTLSIEDNGVGFDTRASDGSGWLGIRERFAILDGNVEIEATRGGGARLEGSLPVKTRVREPGS